MSEFVLPLTSEGAVTAPTGLFAFVEPSAEAETFLDVGPASVLELAEFGWMVADGVNPLRVVTRGSVYDAGGIAPNVSMTLAPSAARATATQDFSDPGAATNPADGDSWTIRAANGFAIPFTIRASLSASIATYSYEVKRGGSLATTIANIAALYNDTGTDGTEYRAGTRPAYFIGSDMHVSVSATTSDTVTYRATVYGAVSWIATEITDGGASWTITNFSGGGTGTGVSPGAGTRRFFFTWYRDADGAETGRSPIVSVDTSSPGSIAISGLTASADTTFDYIRIYSTADLGVEFYLLGAIPRASSTFTDDVDDTVLVRGLPWSDLQHRDYTEGAPPRGMALALWKGSAWTIGAHRAADYVRGTVSVTEDSAAVTFSLKGVTALMRNRTFQVAATSETYRLISIDESARTAVLDRAYVGTTNGTAAFTILDDYDCARLRRCVEGLWSQWPEDESPGRVDTDDDSGQFSLLATRSRLFALSRTSIVALTGDGPESWEMSKVGQGVGCYAPRLVVGIDAGDGIVTGGIFLGRGGFYAINADGAMACISSPPVRRGQLARGIDGTVARINWSAADQGYAVFDTTNRCVVFGLPLDVATTPNYEIVFDLQNQTWTTFKRAEWTEATTATLPDGSQFILAGDRDGHLWHADVGEADGFFGTEPVQTLTGAQTVRALTVTGTPFSTSGDGESGKPGMVLYADGSTTAYFKVASNTNAVLTLCEDLSTAPAAGDQIVLGMIDAIAASGFTTFGEEFRRKSVKSVTVRHAPISRGTYSFLFAVDGGSFQTCPVGTSKGDLTQADGKERHFVQYPGDAHAFKIRRLQPGGRAVIRGGVFEILVREQPTR